jgi:hypothetical protein
MTIFLRNDKEVTGAGIGNLSFNNVHLAFNNIDTHFTDTSISLYNRIILSTTSSIRVGYLPTPIYTRL